MSVTWEHPAFGTVTFEDRRVWQGPEGQTITFRDPCSQNRLNPPQQVDVTETVEYKTLVEAMATCPRHEARHAVVGMFLDFKPVEARADFPEDHILGHVQFDFSGEKWTRERLGEFALSLIAGSIGDENTSPISWPLRTDRNATNDEKQLASVVAQLELGQKQYEGLVDVAREIVEHPSINSAIDYVETMLAVMPLTGTMLRDLFKSAFKDVEREAAAPSTEELEHAVAVEQHRQSMVAYLAACDEYGKQEEAKALRRTAEQIARDFERGQR